MISAKAVSYTEGYRSGHNEAVLKTVWAHAHVGSNPTPSAINPRVFAFGFFFLVSLARSVVLVLIKNYKRNEI